MSVRLSLFESISQPAAPIHGRAASLGSSRRSALAGTEAFEGGTRGLDFERTGGLAPTGAEKLAEPKPGLGAFERHLQRGPSSNGLLQILDGLLDMSVLGGDCGSSISRLREHRGRLAQLGDVGELLEVFAGCVQVAESDLAVYERWEEPGTFEGGWVTDQGVA